jgi:type II secretory pathway component PulF
MQYTYKARDEEGVLRTGTVEAASEASAFETLKEHGLIVISVALSPNVSFLDKLNLFNRVSAKDLVLFSRQLSTLIDASVPIVQALKILQYQVSSPALQKIVADITQKIEAGESLSTALSYYPNVFSSLYINLVRSAELSGTIKEALNYLANQVEKDYDLRSKIIGAMAYPLFVIVTLVVVGFLMFLFVLPELLSVVREANVDLPLATRLLIAITDFLQNFWWLLILLLFAAFVGFRYYSQTFGGRYVVDAAKLKAPFFGKLYAKIYIARFTRNLSTLVAGGIPIVKALESVADIIGNKVYHDSLIEVATQVRNGKSVALALSDMPEFPPIVSQMTQIGETTGKLQEILDKLASFYEKEVATTVTALTTLLEPAIMILLGFAVAIMVAGILLPIYNLAGSQ